MELVVGSLIFFFGGMIQGCTGFGMALLAAPSLAFIMDAKMVPVTIISISLVNTLLVAYEARRHILPHLILPLAAGGLVGMYIGTEVVTELDPLVLRTGLGVFVTVVAVAMLMGWRRPLPDAAWVRVPVGMVSGFFGGTTGAGGPPVVLFLSNQGTPKDSFRANVVAYFFLINCAGVVAFAAKGVFTTHFVMSLAIITPTMLAGTYLGMRMAGRVPQEPFRRVVMVTVCVMGLSLLAKSMVQLVQGG